VGVLSVAALFPHFSTAAGKTRNASSNTRLFPASSGGMNWVDNPKPSAT